MQQWVFTLTYDSIKKTIRGNLGVMMATAGIWTFSGQLVWPFQSIYILRLGGSYFHIGLIASIGALAGIIPNLLGGILADTLGRRKIIVTMSFLVSLNTLVYYFAKDWKWLIIGVIINSIAIGLRQPAFSSIIADSTKETNRAQSYALWSTVPPLLGILSPYLMGVYMEKYGDLPMLRLGYLILFFCSFIASIIRYFTLKETISMDPENAYGVPHFFIRDILKSLGEAFSVLTRPLWILGLMGLFFGFGAAIGSPFWVTYATEDVILLSLSQWGLIAAANSLTTILVSFPLGRIADRSGRLKLLLPSIALMPIAIIAFTFSRGFVLTFLISIVITVFGSMGMTSGQALFTDLIEKRYRGRINALWSVAGVMQSFSIGVSPGSLLGATGSLLGGYIYETIGKAVPLYIQSGMIFLAAIFGIKYLSEPSSRAR
jgi:MFS family permease